MKERRAVRRGALVAHGFAGIRATVGSCASNPGPWPLDRKNLTVNLSHDISLSLLGKSKILKGLLP